MSARSIRDCRTPSSSPVNATSRRSLHGRFGHEPSSLSRSAHHRPFACRSSLLPLWETSVSFSVMEVVQFPAKHDHPNGGLRWSVAGDAGLPGEDARGQTCRATQIWRVIKALRLGRVIDLE